MQKMSVNNKCGFPNLMMLAVINNAEVSNLHVCLFFACYLQVFCVFFFRHICATLNVMSAT